MDFNSNNFLAFLEEAKKEKETAANNRNSSIDYSSVFTVVGHVFNQDPIESIDFSKFTVEDTLTAFLETQNIVTYDTEVEGENSSEDNAFSLLYLVQRTVGTLISDQCVKFYENEDDFI